MRIGQTNNNNNKDPKKKFGGFFFKKKKSTVKRVQWILLDLFGAPFFAWRERQQNADTTRTAGAEPSDGFG